ncbi:protein of unknown function [Acetoanaerobium sticklandii]|uniref:Uncharacterized protein n=1 Tax=Acetoanaerobium sticklandii (strain ATCC 12662 / DSM 519 / JCM 1433 / CCUG 9281 / NCIMB 10654 / HF) TaxID=499177 RepID=E3PY68_ACESD|nr:hypothetical protein [Acetoanaerobium sticklandii]CBH21383.1 protein of unknown function [Acetoanaerobium sticklandii]
MIKETILGKIFDVILGQILKLLKKSIYLSLNIEYFRTYFIIKNTSMSPIIISEIGFLEDKRMFNLKAKCLYSIKVRKKVASNDFASIGVNSYLIKNALLSSENTSNIFVIPYVKDHQGKLYKMKKIYMDLNKLSDRSLCKSDLGL